MYVRVEQWEMEWRSEQRDVGSRAAGRWVQRRDRQLHRVTECRRPALTYFFLTLLGGTTGLPCLSQIWSSEPGHSTQLITTPASSYTASTQKLESAPQSLTTAPLFNALYSSQNSPQDKVHFLPGLQDICDEAPQRSRLLFLSLHALSSSQVRLLAFRCTCLHIHICTYHLPSFAHVAPSVDNSLPSKSH